MSKSYSLQKLHFPDQAYYSRRVHKTNGKQIYVHSEGPDQSRLSLNMNFTCLHEDSVFQIVGVCEPREYQRQDEQKLHNIPPEHVFSGTKLLFTSLMK